MIGWADEAQRIGAGLTAGLLIGIERGWHLRTRDAGSRVAGIRTFALLGLGGGLAGLLGAKGQPLMGGTIVIASAAVLVLGYANSLRERHDATTAVVALVTLTIGLLAGLGSSGLALAAAAVVVLVLAMREELHGFIDRLDERDVKALARFAVIALGVLPFLPNRAMGPYGAWNPSKLWWVVILVTGSFPSSPMSRTAFSARAEARSRPP